MLSILIPTYNYNVYPLACQLEQQARDANIVFEIICFDDGSKSQLNSKNNSINSLNNCSFNELSINIGRSAIRNLLGKNAKYETLLFIDAGTLPKNDTFIKNYLSLISKEVVSGGMTHLKKEPEAKYKLRWIYTKKRESKTFCSSNFMIKKQTFLNFPFDETLKQYGYEDVLFFETLKTNNIDIYSFNNPVVHECDDDANTFLIKTEKAICNLKNLIKQNKLNKNQSTIIKYYLYIKKLRIKNIIGKLFKLSKPLLSKNLRSKHASLLFYDAYRLGYLCSL
ncbi:glycosyltransferase family 2 protein [Thalassobellus sediminis]|uniref:glycosyltransferase family 2 protein n=1 Tax=Thalassobellus sediminis TaxID=3367753 RepID=UPI003798C61C